MSTQRSVASRQRCLISPPSDELSNLEIRLIKWIIGTGVVALLTLSAQLWGAVQLLLRLGHQ